MRALESGPDFVKRLQQPSVWSAALSRVPVTPGNCQKAVKSFQDSLGRRTVEGKKKWNDNIFFFFLLSYSGKGNISNISYLKYSSFSNQLHGADEVNFFPWKFHLLCT